MALGGVRKQKGRWLALWYTKDGVKRSKTIGLVSKMTKTEARATAAEIVKEVKKDQDTSLFGSFVEGPYFDFFGRKWKDSTRYMNKKRIQQHLIEPYRGRDLASFKRDELQALLDSKSKTYSFSVVDHLKWDLSQIFNMAVAEGLIKKNPAALLFTPKEAKRPEHCVMTLKDVRKALDGLDGRDRLIFELAVLGGMRPGEIFGLTWAHVDGAAAEVTQRVYRGKIDTPKTHHSVRHVALSDDLVKEMQAWKELSGGKGYVFPSEKGTPLAKENVWRRNLSPKLKKLGLEWVTFQVMRRTHATLMRTMNADPRAVASQLGHSVDVSLNVYAQSPLSVRRPLVNKLQKLILK